MVKGYTMNHRKDQRGFSTLLLYCFIKDCNSHPKDATFKIVWNRKTKENNNMKAPIIARDIMALMNKRELFIESYFVF